MSSIVGAFVLHCLASASEKTSPNHNWRQEPRNQDGIRADAPGFAITKMWVIRLSRYSSTSCAPQMNIRWVILGRSPREFNALRLYFLSSLPNRSLA
jgi:hypothetical protein